MNFNRMISWITCRNFLKDSCCKCPKNLPRVYSRSYPRKFSMLRARISANLRYSSRFFPWIFTSNATRISSTHVARSSSNNSTKARFCNPFQEFFKISHPKFLRMRFYLPDKNNSHLGRTSYRSSSTNFINNCSYFLRKFAKFTKAWIREF